MASLRACILYGFENWATLHLFLACPSQHALLPMPAKWAHPFSLTFWSSCVINGKRDHEYFADQIFTGPCKKRKRGSLTPILSSHFLSFSLIALFLLWSWASWMTNRTTTFLSHSTFILFYPLSINLCENHFIIVS